MSITYYHTCSVVSFYNFWITAALRVTEFLRGIADTGKIVVMTLHQPRAAIWEMVDRVHLLSQGYTIASGETKKVMNWMKDQGFYLADGLKNQITEPDYLLDVVTLYQDKPNFPYKTMRQQHEIEKVAKAWNENNGMHFVATSWRPARLVKSDAHSIPFFRGLYLLTKKTILSYVKDSTNLFARLVAVLCSCLLALSLEGGLSAVEDATLLYMLATGYDLNVLFLPPPLPPFF